MIRLASVLSLGLSLALAGGAEAAPPAKLPVEVYGRLPNIELMELSPSGELLAYIQINGDTRQLIVKDLTGKTLLASPVGDKKIRDLDWAGEDHLIVTASAAQRLFGASQKREWGHTIVVRLDSRKAFEVFFPSETIISATFGYHGAVQQGGHWYGFFGGVPYQKTRGFEPTLNEDNFFDLFRVDLDSGAASLTASGQQRPHEWALSPDGAVAAQAEYDQQSGVFTIRGGQAGGPVLGALDAPLGQVGLAGLGRAADTIVVANDVPEEWSLKSGAHAPLAEDRLIEGFIHDPTSKRLLGLWLTGDRPEQRWFDPVLKARQAAFAKALGGQPILVSWSADFTRLILFTGGDGDAGTYWLFDGKGVKPYGYAYPELPDANVGARQIIRYHAADGLALRGVLTLPPGRPASALPLVVMPHGGPEAHDTLEFDWLAEAFAGRGYAVFQPNFRGSDEQGKAFRDAGFG